MNGDSIPRKEASPQDPSRYREIGRSTLVEINFRAALEKYCTDSPGSQYEKFENFPKYVSRQTISRYIALYEIFKNVLSVQGDIIECGVNWGGGLLWFAQISAALEPFNLQRRLVGFDTFEGFPELHVSDISPGAVGKEHKAGGYRADSLDDIRRCRDLYDANRPIGHIQKIMLVKGDACDTIPQYLAKNPHTVVSLLHLDFDIYLPTKKAIDHFLPRIPKGGVIIFDEINCPKWPGETTAVIDSIGLDKLRIQRFPFEPYISYAILE